MKENDKADDTVLEEYAKYVLKSGPMHEKRELLANLKNKIVLKDRKVSLEKSAS
jgi:hypothetical protein